MPSLDWNRRWAGKLARFAPGGVEGVHYGDRWGDPLVDPALAAIRARFLTPYVRPDAVALEIGSGGGRWTQFLLPCRRVYCVDLNAEMFPYLAERFQGQSDLVFVPTTGADLPGVPADSIDFAFSYGTLVHCEAEIVGAYLAALAHVLRPGGTACLHLADTSRAAGRAKDGFAACDPERAALLVAAAGLRLAEVDSETLPHSTLIRAERLRLGATPN